MRFSSCLSSTFISVIAATGTAFAGEAEGLGKLFELRQKCEDLASSFVAGKHRDQAFTREFESNLSDDAGHCYVRVDDNAYDLAARTWERRVYLYDVQNRQLLATYTLTEHGGEGHVFDDGWREKRVGAETPNNVHAAVEYIKLRMQTKR